MPESKRHRRRRGAPRLWSEDVLLMDMRERETLKVLPRTSWVEIHVVMGELSVESRRPTSNRMLKPVHLLHRIKAHETRVLTSPLGVIRVEAATNGTEATVKTWREPKEDRDDIARP